MPKNKTDNFLKAIKKYAKLQKYAISGEVKQFKTERLKEAEKTAKRDSEAKIRKQVLETRNRQTATIAAKTQEGQRKLFIERSAMVEEVFKLAEAKLSDFTKTDGYPSKLLKSAGEIAELFDGKDCVLYVNERDLHMADKLRELFSGSVQVSADKTIRIGGVRGYCESMRIIADETFDSKLEAQREWFIENASLSVLS